MKQVFYKFNKAVNQGGFEQEKVDIKEPVNDERNYRKGSEKIIIEDETKTF